MYDSQRDGKYIYAGIYKGAKVVHMQDGQGVAVLIAKSDMSKAGLSQ